MTIGLKPSKHSAPGQYLGFALQPVRAFYHLLTCPKGAKVSLEHADDVAIHYPDSGLCLEQTKSAPKQNPISDWADDLWKTFSNWSGMLSTKQIDAAKTRYRIYVTPPRKGNFVEAMAKAQDAEAAEIVLKTIRTKLGRLKTDPGCETSNNSNLAIFRRIEKRF